MRKIAIIAAAVLVFADAHAQGVTAPQTAEPAPTAASEPQTVPKPEAPTTPAAAPAQAAPAAQAAPNTIPQPSPKPVKKRQAKRHETDEQKARRIAAKYGVSW
jgi:hypothetical protein